MHCLFYAVLETVGEEILVNYINERHYNQNYKMSINTLHARYFVDVSIANS
jgi:hypothetical protein